MSAPRLKDRSDDLRASRAFLRDALVLFVPAVLALALSAGEAAAQRPQTREGFWIGFGLGFASFHCESCDDREPGGAFMVKLGGSVSQKVLIGFEANSWLKEEEPYTLSQTNLNAVVYFYPSATGGFHLKGGIGLAVLNLEADLGGGFSFTETETGGGILLGLGYDARIGRNLSLVPFLNLLGANFDGTRTDFVQLGLGLTFH